MPMPHPKAGNIVPRDGQDWHKLVRLLGAPETQVRVEGEKAVIYGRRRQVSLRLGSVAVEVLHKAVSAGAVAASGRNRQVYTLTAAGDALTRRLKESPEEAFGMQHRQVTRVALEQDAGLVSRNDTESPLLWLHRRKGKAGVGLIGDAEFAAGERLRADMTLAQIMPRMGVDWSRPGVDGGGAGPQLHASEAMLAARMRVERALKMVGPDLSGLLVDLCFFLKGLTEIERERGWPIRSAKVVVVIGLRQLARHYGLSNQARGRPQTGKPQFWGTPDYRPDFSMEAEG